MFPIFFLQSFGSTCLDSQVYDNDIHMQKSVLIIVYKKL